MALRLLPGLHRTAPNARVIFLSDHVDEATVADLTRQLLAFGRKQMPTLQLLDLNLIIEEINKMLPRLIGEDIEARETCTAALPDGRTVPARLRNDTAGGR